MEQEDNSVRTGQNARLPGPVTSMSPHLKGGLPADGSDSGVGVGVGSVETSFDLSDLKNHSPSGSALSSPPGSAPSRLSPSPAHPPKRRRGRPPGARNRQRQQPPLNVVLGKTATEGFTPYFTTVKTGENVLAKVLSFPLNGAQGVCVLSAVGTVSNVTIRPLGAHTSNSLTYEGLFEILSLTGSYVANDPRGTSKTGRLTISIAGANGSVIGGTVAGVMAASPIQMVLGSFCANAPRLQKRKYTRRAPLNTNVTTAASATAPTGSFHSDNTTGPLLSSHRAVDAAAASPDTVASESPIDLSAEDDYATTNTHAVRDVQNLNTRPQAPAPPSAFDCGESRNGSEHTSLLVQYRWRYDINAFPGRQG